MNVVSDDKNAQHDLTNWKLYDQIIKTIITITKIDLRKFINQPPYVSREHPSFFFHSVTPRKFRKEKSSVNPSPSVVQGHRIFITIKDNSLTVSKLNEQ